MGILLISGLVNFALSWSYSLRTYRTTWTLRSRRVFFQMGRYKSFLALVLVCPIGLRQAPDGWIDEQDRNVQEEAASWAGPEIAGII